MRRFSCGMIFLWDDFPVVFFLRILAFADVFFSAGVCLFMCFFVADDVFLRIILDADDSFCG